MGTIMGKSVQDVDRELDVRADPESPDGERWALLTLNVGKPLSVRVPVAALRAELDKINPINP